MGMTLRTTSKQTGDQLTNIISHTSARGIKHGNLPCFFGEGDRHWWRLLAVAREPWTGHCLLCLLWERRSLNCRVHREA